MIDLRWGVETVSAGEEQAKEMLVLKVCLAEIERSRPFLIGLIGDRYGWVLPEERLEAAAREAGYTAEVRGRSITALEIEYGVLESTDQRRRSHFYFRHPLPYDEMDPAIAADYSEAHTGDAQAPQRRAALDALERRIARQLPDRTHRYSAAWDKERQTVTGLEAFGRMVLEHLWQDLEAELPALAERALTTLGDVLREQGDLAGALRAYGESLAISERLASADPSNATWQGDLIGSYTRMAVLTKGTDVDDPLDWWRKAYETLADMEQRGIM